MAQWYATCLNLSHVKYTGVHAYSGQRLIRFDASSGQKFCSSVNAVGLVGIHGNCTPRLIRSKGQNKRYRIKRGPL